MVTERSRLTFCLLVLSALASSKQVFSQDEPPAIEWQRTLGGDALDVGHAVQQTSDGGFVVTGSTISFGAGRRDAYLLRTDEEGNFLWQQAFGGQARDEAYAVRQTEDGGFVVAGTSHSFGNGDGDVYLVRTDEMGNPLWEKTFGSEGQDEGRAVELTDDGGFIVAGSRSGPETSHVYLLRTDGDGELLWEKTVGGAGIQTMAAFDRMRDGGFVIVGTGFCDIGVYRSLYVVRTDGDGEILWERCFPGKGDSVGEAVQRTSDGGVIAAGWTGFLIYDAYLIRLDPEGEVIWEKTFGGEMSGSVLQAGDGGFVAAGYTNLCTEEVPCHDEVYLVRTDADGNLLWETMLVTERSDNAVALEPTSDGGWVITGRTHSFEAQDSDVYLAKIAPERSAQRIFVRSDVDESGEVDLTDAIFTLNWLFLGGSPPDCEDAVDADDDGEHSVSDPVYTLSWLFLGGTRPAEPFVQCGPDPTPDGLTCASYGPCE